jgi:TolB-like protein
LSWYAGELVRWWLGWLVRCSFGLYFGVAVTLLRLPHLLHVLLVVLLVLTGLPLGHSPALAAEALDAVTYEADDGPLQLYRRSYAIVVGIDRYQTLPVLGGAVRDAKAMSAFLQKQGFEVTTVLEGEATRARLARLIGDELPAKLQPDDRVLIYFAGHGVSRGQGDAAMGYLMPVEGDRSAPASTAISMAEVSRWFGQYAAKHVMLVADACYSGLALGSRSVGIPPETRDYVREVTKRPVRVVLVAGGAGEEANEFGGHGLFTGQLLQAVQGAADGNRDGLVTSDELAAFVKPNVAQIARREFGANQHPQLGRMGEGEFLFLVDGAASRPKARPSDRDDAADDKAAPQTRSVDRKPQPAAPAPPPATERPRVAVLYFDYNGKNDELAALQKGIAQMLVTSLQQTGVVEVIERERLEAVLGELKLQKGKAIDPATAVRVGKLLGVRYLVLGGYVDLLGRLRIDTRVVEVQTGRIAGTAASQGKIEEFFALHEELAGKLVAALGAMPTSEPPARTASGKSPPKGIWVDYARALEAYDRGDRKAAWTLTDDILRNYPDFSPAVRLKRLLTP